MSYSISTLLTRNLQDVFGENDPALRRTAIDEIWTEDGVFYDPKTGVHRGRDEIDGVAGAIRATHPDFRYQPIAKPEELGDGGRVKWVAGRPGEAPAYAGTDFIIAPGRPDCRPFISFSTSYPELDEAAMPTSPPRHTMFVIRASFLRNSELDFKPAIEDGPSELDVQRTGS
jgi:hypothetical protein